MKELLAKRLLKFLLVPVARYCFRYAMHIQDMLEVAKVVFVEQACREIESVGEKVNVSRLSVITGLHRRDVERIYKRQEVHEAPQGFLSKVLGQWQYDPRFSTKGHEPKLLSHEGAESEFHELVSSVSSDINPGTVMFELERRNLVRRSANGKIQLVQGVLDVCRTLDDESWEEGFQILSKDISDLSDAVQENLSGSDASNLHGRTEFDCIEPRYESEIRSWLLKEGSQFHRRVCEYLSKYDSDFSPNGSEDRAGRADGVERTGETIPLRVSVGAYSFISRENFIGRNNRGRRS